MKQKYDKKYVVSFTGQVEYTAKVREDLNDQRVAIFYSLMNPQWTSAVRGKLALSVESDGNGVTVHLTYGNEIRLDYCEVEQLRAALNLISDSPQKVYELK